MLCLSRYSPIMITKILAVSSISLFSLSCAMQTATYSPPVIAADNDPVWERELALPFDDVWEALIDHASGTFFAIENFEKESGLMTLSFGASDIVRFVDGGHWTSDWRPAGGKLRQFDGNYVTYLEETKNGELVGSMNIFVKRVGERNTLVKVRARYVVTASPRTANQNTWSFDTGGTDTVVAKNPAAGFSPERTMRPTHAAELSILNAVEKLGAR
jgi:hypothetical protein